MLVELLEEEGALEAHFLDSAVEPDDAGAGAVVGVVDVGYAPLEVDAFAIVGGFDRGREVFLTVVRVRVRDGAGCCEEG